jgi:nitrogen fixation/metabolism regulation signal transduction histidine kinase
MVFKRFRFQIIARVLGVGLSIFALFWSIYETEFLMTPIVFTLLSVGQLIALIYYVENSTRELKRFFRSFADRDYTKVFDSDYKGKAFQEINETFDQIIKAFQQVNIEKQEYYQYLKQVNEHVEVALISFKADGKIDLMNKAAQRLLKKPLLYSIDALANTHPEIHSAFTTLDSSEKTLLKTTIDGEQFSLALVVKKFKLSGVGYTLAALQDIRQELQTNEIDAWHKLIRVLTHEIMNSLTPVVSLSTAIRQIVSIEGQPKNASELTNDEVNDIFRSMQAIENRGRGLLSFVNAYRDYTKIPVLEKEVVNLESLVTEVVNVLTPTLKNIAVHITSQESDIVNQIDKNLVSQVLINLFNNAAEALEKTKKPEIRVYIDSSVYKSITICDNGHGVPLNIIDQIFIPFFTTKTKGNGIGLSLSKQIMKAHGGDLTLQSSETGSKFEVRF